MNLIDYKYALKNYIIEKVEEELDWRWLVVTVREAEEKGSKWELE